ITELSPRGATTSISTSSRRRCRTKRERPREGGRLVLTLGCGRGTGVGREDAHEVLGQRHDPHRLLMLGGMPARRSRGFTTSRTSDNPCPGDTVPTSVYPAST